MLALAEAHSKFGIANVLNPPAIKNGTDISLGYLEDIFGIVDGVLHGSGSQIMGELFGMFNAAALVLAVIIVLYTTILTIANTAAEGSFLGQKYSSIWIPLRTVLGIALLVPKATGYSAIQIFMMWVIVQGIGAADSIWDSALKYLSRGGVIVQQSLAPQGNIAKQAKDIFRTQVCMYGVELALRQARRDVTRQNLSNLPFVPAFSPTINALDRNICPRGKKSCYLRVPGSFTTTSQDANRKRFNTLTGVCGAITLDTNVPSGMDDNKAAELRETKLIAGHQLVDTLGGAAKQMVNAKLYPRFTGQDIADVVGDYTSYGGVNNRIFLQAAEDYQGLVAPAGRVSDAAQRGKQKWIREASKDGWILAGRYYQKLVNLNKSFQKQFFDSPPKVTSLTEIKACLEGNSGCPSRSYPSSRGGDDIHKLLNNLLPGSRAGRYGDMVKQFVTTGTEFIDGNEDKNNNFNKFVGKAPVEDAAYGGRKSTKEANFSAPAIQASGLLSSLVPIFGPLASIGTKYAHLAKAQQSGVNPVVVLASIGSSLINLVVQIYVVGATVITASTAELAGVPFMGLGTIIIAVVSFIAPLMLTLSTLLFVNGVIYAYYIPLIPFIIFLFGAIGWLMQVVETMVAAPIVALGITHPEGSEILGKADPAVLILVNVFLRPSMMIIGLIGAIILSYVSVWLLNAGFFYAFFSAVKSNVSGFALYLFIFPALITIYTLLVVGLLNRVFDLINQVPDRVMTWIGGQGFSVAGEARQAAGEVKGGLQSGAKAGAEGMQSSMQQGGKQLGEQIGQSMQPDSGDMELISPGEEVGLPGEEPDEKPPEEKESKGEESKEEDSESKTPEGKKGAGESSAGGKGGSGADAALSPGSGPPGAK
ncbi:MAG: type IVB secretion system protein DotA [Pseudomonadota bacterium]